MKPQQLKKYTIHPDLIEATNSAYEPSGLMYKNLETEAEGKEYGACTFELNDKLIKFRVGKITPTKIGQFVTFWKRIGNSVIQPYDINDSIDFFVVSVRNSEHFGQFVFPKSILFEKGILSKDGKGGKRAIRVYPSWDIAENQQAKSTQAWQLRYFFEIPASGGIDIIKVQNLFYC